MSLIQKKKPMKSSPCLKKEAAARLLSPFSPPAPPPPLLRLHIRPIPIGKGSFSRVYRLVSHVGAAASADRSASSPFHRPGIVAKIASAGSNSRIESCRMLLKREKAVLSCIFAEDPMSDDDDAQHVVRVVDPLHPSVVENGRSKQELLLLHPPSKGTDVSNVCKQQEKDYVECSPICVASQSCLLLEEMDGSIETVAKAWLGNRPPDEKDEKDVACLFPSDPHLSLFKELPRIFQHMLCALRELDQKNVIHRDLKPDNVLYRRQDREACDGVVWKLADFGLAVTREDAEVTVPVGNISYSCPRSYLPFAVRHHVPTGLPPPVLSPPPPAPPSPPPFLRYRYCLLDDLYGVAAVLLTAFLVCIRRATSFSPSLSLSAASLSSFSSFSCCSDPEVQRRRHELPLELLNTPIYNKISADVLAMYRGVVAGKTSHLGKVWLASHELDPRQRDAVAQFEEACKRYVAEAEAGAPSPSPWAEHRLYQAHLELHHALFLGEIHRRIQWIDHLVHEPFSVSVRAETDATTSDVSSSSRNSTTTITTSLFSILLMSEKLPSGDQKEKHGDAYRWLWSECISILLRCTDPRIPIWPDQVGEAGRRHVFDGPASAAHYPTLALLSEHCTKRLPEEIEERFAFI
jgi:serine/threonine protein kinase